MTGYLIAYFISTVITTVLCTRHHHTSDLCRPCAGSSPSLIRRFPNWHIPETGRQCSVLNEINVRLSELKMNISTETQDLVNGVFDRDVSYLDENPLVFSGISITSPMALTYNKLVYLHVVMKLLETHPDKYACAITTSAVADRLPFCHLRSIIPHSVVESIEYRAVCRENGYIDINSCPQVQRYAYRVLRTASSLLHDVQGDIRRYHREYGCPRV